jgi:hypothetical protein
MRSLSALIVVRQRIIGVINHALVMADRERVGRDASPSAAIIDSQSVKTTEARRLDRIIHPGSALRDS